MTNNANSALLDVSELTSASINLHLLLESTKAADKAQCIDESRMQKCCLLALMSQAEMTFKSGSDVELSVQFVNAETMQALNNQYRGKNVPTNVLSFESDMPPMMTLDSEEEGALQVLGDLVFCPEVVLAEAEAQKKTSEQHWQHLFVHGTLHLCGYDHEEAAQAETMESLEIQILSALGIPDPYGTSD